MEKRLSVAALNELKDSSSTICCYRLKRCQHIEPFVFV